MGKTPTYVMGEKIAFLILGMVWYVTLPESMKKMVSDGHHFDARRSPPHS
jgi:hypothetical protein